MEVVKTSSDILCNSEVLQFLREEREKNLQKANQFRKENKGGQAATVVLETLTYLDKSPCTDLEPNKVSAFFDKLSESGIDLNSREKLQLLNHCPTVSIFLYFVLAQVQKKTNSVSKTLMTIKFSCRHPLRFKSSLRMEKNDFLKSKLINFWI